MSEFWADQLRRERLNRQLSQRELADLVGVSQTTLSDWESGRRKPLRERAQAWARELDVVLPEGVLASLVLKYAACGTDRGYGRHRRDRTDACDPCLRAHTDYGIGYQRRRREVVSGA